MRGRGPDGQARVDQHVGDLAVRQYAGAEYLDLELAVGASGQGRGGNHHRSERHGGGLQRTDFAEDLIAETSPQDDEILAINDFDSDIYATPAVSDSKMYIRTRDAMYAIGTPK